MAYGNDIKRKWARQGMNGVTGIGRRRGSNFAFDQMNRGANVPRGQISQSPSLRRPIGEPPVVQTRQVMGQPNITGGEYTAETSGGGGTYEGGDEFGGISPNQWLPSDDYYSGYHPDNPGNWLYQQNEALGGAPGECIINGGDWNQYTLECTYPPGSIFGEGGPGDEDPGDEDPTDCPEGQTWIPDPFGEGFCG
jgi:hypothetical protein